MELVLPFIDAAVARHEGTYFLFPFLDSLWKKTPYLGYVALGEIRENLRVDKQNSFSTISHIQGFKDKNSTNVIIIFDISLSLTPNMV